MPYLRKRHIQSSLNKSLQFSPIVGLFGHRQVGKSTLISEIKDRTYYTFDNRLHRLKFETALEEELVQARNKPISIDECHLLNSLFPALKEAVRVSKIPGAFLLSGSVKFQSKKDIRESLTGRILSLELLPFTLSELENLPYNNLLYKFVQSGSVEFKKLHLHSDSAIKTYFEKGGLPGICFSRDNAFRVQQHENILETLLERDIRLVEPTNLPYETLRRIVVHLSHFAGRDFEFQEWSRRTRVSVPTLKKFLRAMEALFIVRILSSEGGAGKQRIYFEDIGEMRHLLKETPDFINLATHSLFLQARLMRSIHTDCIFEFSFYKTRGGSEIPLIIRAKSSSKNNTLAIIPVEGSYPTPQAIGSFKSFQKKNLNARCIFVTQSGEPLHWSNNSAIIPLGYLL